MQYRRLGTSGLQLSALSFGAWVTFGKQVGRGEARELLALAHDRGVNFFDNAETYNNGVAEQVMGQGKVLYWGTSEWPAEAIHEAHRIARENHLYAPVMEQPQYNLLHRERVEEEYAPLYAAYGMGTTIWSPLGSGLLSGKYNDGVPADSRLAQPDYAWLRESVLGKGDERVGKVRALQPIADELGCSLAQLSIAWCLLNPHVSTVMLGASRREQLEQNLVALEVLPKLDATLARRIRTIVEAA